MSIQADPFSEFRMKKNNESSALPEQPSQKMTDNMQDGLSEFRIKQAEGFPFLKESGRHIARTASRIGEVIGGIPGDIQDFIQSGVFSGLEKLVGIPVSEEMREKVKKDRAPTSKELKNISQESFGDLTKPQGDVEKSIDEYVETATALFGPMKFRKALGVGLSSQAAKEGLKIGGLGEDTQELGKLGTMFLTSMINPGAAMKYASSQYDKANKLAKGASIAIPQFKNNVSNLITSLEKGVETTDKNQVLKPARQILEKIKNGKIKVDELTSAKRDINRLSGEPDTLKGARKLLGSLGKEVDNAIKPYEKINPAFSKAYRPANEIYGAVVQGNKAANFVKKVIGPKSILASLAGEAALGHPEALLPTLGIAGVAHGGARTLDFMTRLAKSPQLQKFYAKAMVAAAAEDARALTLYADKIENIMKKDQSSSER